MESTTTELVPLHDGSDHFSINDELPDEEALDRYWHPFAKDISAYVKSNKRSQNTKLFSFLALLNTYVPKSYLLQSQCQEVLGPPDLIHGGPSLEQRMEPFTKLIKTLDTNTGPPKRVYMIHPVIAQSSMQLLVEAGFTRSGIVEKLMMTQFLGDQAQPDTFQFMKDSLTKREMGKRGRDKFSRLIEDIRSQECFQRSVSVLSAAAKKFKRNFSFPQTLSRLYYITTNYKKAEAWAKEAIKRAPLNSYVADTLGQVHKNRLLRKARDERRVFSEAKKAIKAFKVVEEKAEREEGPDTQDAELVNVSNTFNNRGIFGCIQVAKIIFQKLTSMCEEWRGVLTGERDTVHQTSLESILQENRSLIVNLRNAVQDKFDFLEWYTTYSQPDIQTSEPSYFWSDVALCYQQYNTRLASQSNSFPGLLHCLYHGLILSKGSHVGLGEARKTASDLLAIRDDLKTSYESNVSDVKAAEAYVLSNIVLSNKVPDSPSGRLTGNLRMIIHRFLNQGVGQRSPEFYLLVLLLFWPQQLVVREEEEEENGPTTEDDGSTDDNTWEDRESQDDDDDDDEEQEEGGEMAQSMPDSLVDSDLNKYVGFMQNAFEKNYAKYLRGRYLLPLFFLGRGHGLSRWVHKSKLDEILEEKAKEEEHGAKKERTETRSQVNEMWSSGQVFRIQEIQEILLPVKGEVCPVTMQEECAEREVFACMGGRRIKAGVVEPTASSLDPTFVFYLGFTIRGPVAFNVGPPCV